MPQALKITIVGDGGEDLNRIPHKEHTREIFQAKE
jgi:hypothetical protein